MNIFVLDPDPHQAARMQCDKHVVKMVLESAQLLASAAHAHGVSQPPYAPTHPHHPCTKWAAASRENYLWLLDHFEGLLEEYTRRYGKVHLCERKGMREWFRAHADALPSRGLTPFAQAMPQEYRHPDAVTAYRAYYRGAKSSFARWKSGAIPPWYAADPARPERLEAGSESIEAHVQPPD